MSIDSFISDAFGEWLEATFDGQRVRGIEQGQGIEAGWQAVLDSGFADLMVAESQGGAGAGLETVAEVLQTCGACALPLPLPTTMWVRAALAEEGHDLPSGGIALARGQRGGQSVCCSTVAFGATSESVLVLLDDGAWVLPITDAERSGSGLSVDLLWTSFPTDARKLEGGHDWEAMGAVIFAALMAGAASRVLKLSLAYAAERAQFGKPIGRFQAVQQQLSVLAEEVYAARMAVQLALRGSGLAVDPHRAALAKARASQAVVTLGGIGHMVHGAIGITEEYDLQLYTRRLHDWRLQFGSERYWQQRLGQRLFDSDLPMLDFMRALIGTG